MTSHRLEEPLDYIREGLEKIITLFSHLKVFLRLYSKYIRIKGLPWVAGEIFKTIITIIVSLLLSQHRNNIKRLNSKQC